MIYSDGKHVENGMFEKWCFDRSNDPPSVKLPYRPFSMLPLQENFSPLGATNVAGIISSVEDRIICIAGSGMTLSPFANVEKWLA